MKTVVEPQEGQSNIVKLIVEVGEDDFEPAMAAAFRKIGREVRVPGFRPGKVPRRILEQRVGKGYARAQALEDSLPEFYVRAIVENNVDVISSPQLDLKDGMESGPITFEAIVETRPKVRVPGYDGLQVTIPSPAMTDTEIDAQVDRLRTRFKSMNIVDRQVYDGDAVSIDVAGTVNGEAVPGLTAEDYLYEVGSKSVVPELDANLIGASAGQTLTFDAAVPGDDDSERIDFVVTVKNVQEQVLPEANDEWASTTSEFTTIAELRGDIAKRMGTIKRMQASMAMREETVKALVDLIDAETPETLIDSEVERRIQDLAQRLSQQGATISQYLEATGQSQQQLMDEARGSAIEAVRADLALRAVIEAEAIEASDEDVDTEITRLAVRFKMKPKKVRSNLEKSYQLGILKTDICKAKAVTWLAEHATAVDEDGKAIDPALLIFAPSDLDEDSFGTGSTVEFDDHEGHDHDHDHHDHEGHDHHDHEGHDHE